MNPRASVGTNSRKSSASCISEACRVEMLQHMHTAIQGTSLLLEEIQNDLPMSSEGAFKTLIGTMLSVRSRDETTSKVLEKLWAVYSTPKALAMAPIEEIEELIRSSGPFHQKAQRIQETAAIIHHQYQDQVPRSRELLMEFPGVGRKVANCVLVNAFQIPAIPVDTHVHRIANRTGWVTTLTPEKTEFALESLFPQSSWLILNYALVAFGKMICKPINPLCSKCPVEDRCLKRINPPSTKRSKKITQKLSRI